MQKLILILWGLLLGATSVFAAPISNMVFFGDSLSDNGNLYEILKIMPKSPPYYKGRFSNGPVWAEIMGDNYQNSYNINYKIYAVGGATVVLRNPQDGALPYFLKEEIDLYLFKTSSKEYANTLYVFWIGANDYFTQKDSTVEALTTEVVNEISNQVKRLIEKGGKNFLILDLPDLSATPYGKSQPIEEIGRLKALSELNHYKMFESVKEMQNNFPEIRFIFIDTYTIFKGILANPEIYNQKYAQHITNVIEPCWPGGYVYKNKPLFQEVNLQADTNLTFKSPSLSTAHSVAQAHALGATACPNPDEYLFWDQVHITAAGNAMIAQIMIEKVSPELEKMK